MVSILGGFFAILAIEVGIAQNSSETERFSLGACLFCLVLILAIWGIGQYILNKCDNEIKENWNYEKKYLLKIKNVVYCIMVVCAIFLSTPLVSTAAWFCKSTLDRSD